MSDFKQDDEITPVIFRVTRKRQTAYGSDGVIALFPCEPGSDDVYTCSSYVHIGQHGAAHPHNLIARTRWARPEEYAELKRELESAPYGYRLKVYRRLQQWMLDQRRDALARIK